MKINDKNTQKKVFEKYLRFSIFFSNYYQNHTKRRLEHLDTLDIIKPRVNILELGAGSGDITNYLVNKKCKVFITDARESNIDFLRNRYPKQKIQKLDIDEKIYLNKLFDIVLCYGLLYHVNKPDLVIKRMEKLTRKILIIETSVLFGKNEEVSYFDEDKNVSTNSIYGKGCKPTRIWIFNQLKKIFPYVYLPITQPNHPEFPLNWSKKSDEADMRAIFIASKNKIDNNYLIDYLPEKQFLVKDYKNNY